MSSDKNFLRLTKLSSAALLLPGMTATSTLAVEPIETASVSARLHNYGESDLPQQSSGAEALAAKERYDIDVMQLNLALPVTASADVSISLQQDKMSGASPWYTSVDTKQQIMQVMSGASIEETRTDIEVNPRYFQGGVSYGVRLGVSDEDDYRSEMLGFNYERENAQKTGTWQFAVDYSDDKIEPVDYQIYSIRPIKATRESTSFHLSYSKILNRFSMAQIGISFTEKSGYLADPYKAVFNHTTQTLESEQRPDSRSQWAVSAKWRRYQKQWDSALHADYRYYRDDWEVQSHAVDLALHKNLSTHWQIVPSLRYYSQQRAEFYQAYYVSPRADGLQSTDYRLASYGAVTVGLATVGRFGQWQLRLGAQRYRTDSGWGLKSDPVDNPGLVDFTLVSLGFDYRFQK